MDNLITALGLMAAVCTTFSFIPQALKIIKTRDTKSISLSMYIVFVSGVFLWMIYGFLKGDLPVLIANAVTLVFAGSILYFKIKYP